MLPRRPFSPIASSPPTHPLLRAWPDSCWRARARMRAVPRHAGEASLFTPMRVCVCVFTPQPSPIQGSPAFPSARASDATAHNPPPQLYRAPAAHHSRAAACTGTAFIHPHRALLRARARNRFGCTYGCTASACRALLRARKSLWLHSRLHLRHCSCVECVHIGNPPVFLVTLWGAHRSGQPGSHKQGTLRSVHVRGRGGGWREAGPGRASARPAAAPRCTWGKRTLASAARAAGWRRLGLASGNMHADLARTRCPCLPARLPARLHCSHPAARTCTLAATAPPLA